MHVCYVQLEESTQLVCMQCNAMQYDLLKQRTKTDYIAVTVEIGRLCVCVCEWMLKKNKDAEEDAFSSRNENKWQQQQ